MNWNIVFIVSFSTIFVALFVTLIILMSKDDKRYGQNKCTYGPCYWCLNDNAWEDCGDGGRRMDNKVCQQMDWNNCKNT